MMVPEAPTKPIHPLSRRAVPAGGGGTVPTSALEGLPEPAEDVAHHMPRACVTPLNILMAPFLTLQQRRTAT